MVSTMLWTYMILGAHFALVSVSKNSILKVTEVSKADGLGSLSERFLKDRAKYTGKFPDTCEVAKRKPLYKKGSLTQSCKLQTYFCYP